MTGRMLGNNRSPANGLLFPRRLSEAMFAATARFRSDQDLAEAPESEVAHVLDLTLAQRRREVASVPVEESSSVAV